MSRPAPGAEAAAKRDAKRQRLEAQPSLQTAVGYMAQERRVPNPSIAQHCHADALHCIFAFLDLKDLRL
jgi:hypothetical protein